MTDTHITYYTTLNSPWAYLAGARFRELIARHCLTVEVKPCNFAEVFSQTGGLPLAQRSLARRAYRMMELKRWREALAIPINLEPVGFPSVETQGVRHVLAAIAAGCDAVAFVHEIGRALWEREEKISQIDVLEVAARRARIDWAALMTHLPSEPDALATWEANTAQAVARGVFGAPSYVFEDGEIFWGQDRIDLLAARLARASSDQMES